MIRQGVRLAFLHLLFFAQKSPGCVIQIILAGHEQILGLNPVIFYTMDLTLLYV